MSATAEPIFYSEVTKQIYVTAHVGYGRHVSLEISPDGVRIDVHLDPDEARVLANTLLSAADAADPPRDVPQTGVET